MLQKFVVFKFWENPFSIKKEQYVS